MKNALLLSCFITSLFSCNKSNGQNQQDLLNGDFEKINQVNKYPEGWTHSDGRDYKYAVDSIAAQHGKYALSIASEVDTAGYGIISFVIPKRFEGSEIELKGYLKTEGVGSGFAGLWLRIDGTSAFDNMQRQNIHGTNGWKQYSIKLPYNSQKTINVVGGALLVGKGKIWIDGLQLFIDGKPIENAVPKAIIRVKADLDTAFKNGSGINTITLNPQTINSLRLLGQVWGFLKYHHPAVAKGGYNMDAELFRVMPAVIKARNNSELNQLLEQWTDKFGEVNACDNCKPDINNAVKPTPDYGNLFDHSVLNKSLTDKLRFILNNHKITESYYVSMAEGVGNPLFDHENGYYQMKYPDAGYRLLCLFKYWNMVQYFFPYKHLIGKDWNQSLPEFIPQFVNDKNSTEYILTTLKLISSIHDTHANIWSGNAELEAYRGKYRPSFKAGFVENKLVITSFESDSLAVKEKFRIGDVITAINGIAIDELIKKYLPITAASNYATQLRDMPGNYLLRSNNPHFEFTMQRDGNQLNAVVEGVLVSKNGLMGSSNLSVKDPGYYLINEQIGYLYPAKYHNANLPAIREMFKNTRGIIIDMRCYPSEFMPFTFGAYVKSGTTPFVKFTNGSINKSGLFVETPPLNIKPDDSYQGKVVVIVNEQSQSQAEYTTMAFQSSPNVKVIGSTTAGADGNVSQIILPGGISSLFSGIGVLYPDGTQTQRKGVKIDVIVKPTIKGIKAGVDEPLEKAKALIME
ncbi:S41 family peptidase [Mucilaginibacter gossypii]|uniref:Peptidase family S41 n=2 Tax=Mucilaginibacter TaxID=423349 RepID=A0A1G7ZBU3_9SPHI|nr:S41 family peptidase [Mucilaginibacter gossypii]SDH06221.1 Peptidase family S41 [Mucilaginibacter gossypii]